MAAMMRVSLHKCIREGERRESGGFLADADIATHGATIFSLRFLRQVRHHQPVHSPPKRLERLERLVAIHD
jgi:hypothetical protein